MAWVDGPQDPMVMLKLQNNYVDGVTWQINLTWWYESRIWNWGSSKLKDFGHEKNFAISS